MGKLVCIFLLTIIVAVSATDHKEEIGKLFDDLKPSNDVISADDWLTVKREGVDWVHGIMREDEAERKKRDIQHQTEDDALEASKEDEDDDDDDEGVIGKEELDEIENRITKKVMQKLGQNVEEFADEVANEAIADLVKSKPDAEDEDIEILNDIDDEEETSMNKNDPKPWFGRRRRRRRRRWFARRRRTTKACPSTGCSTAIKYANGCGAKGSNYQKFLLYKDTLKCSCDKHDICYYCGQKWSVSRASCDSSFLNDQKTLCRRKYAWWRLVNRNACLAWAYVQYSAVRVGGSKHYASSSPAWCNESCVKNFAHSSKGVKK